jgi:hypothetical protein
MSTTELEESMPNFMRPGRGGNAGAWGVVALASGGSAAAAAVAGVAVGHPVGGLVVAGCVLILPWLLAGVLVVAVAVLALRRPEPARVTTDVAGAATDDPRVRLIEALLRVIEVLLRR